MKMLKVSTLWPVVLLAASAACSGLPIDDSAPASGEDDVGQIQEAVLLPAQNTPFGFRKADGVSSIVSLGNDAHIHEMTSTGTTWSAPVNLNTPFNPDAPSGLGNPSGYITGREGGIFTSHVIYRSGSNHVIQLQADAGAPWSLTNLTTATGSPAAASDPAGMLRSGGGTGNAVGDKSVVYRSSSDDIIELSMCGGLWNWRNLTTFTGAPKASGAPKVYTRVGGIPTVVYRSTANDVIELIYYNGGWRDGNLSGITGAVDAADEPMGYARKELNVDSVVYRGTNHHIIELYLVQGSNWNDGDLTALSGAPNAEGRPWGYVRHDNVNAVVFRGSNNHIWEIALQGGWVAHDLSVVAGATVNAASSPRAFKRSSTSSAVVYRGTDNRIYELRFSGGAWTVTEAS